MLWTVAPMLVVLSLGILVAGTSAAECAAPKAVVSTAVGMKYCVDTSFDTVVAGQIQTIRQDIRAQRQSGKLVIYSSTPISPRGGGNMEINLEIAASVKTRLEREYGAAVWVLDPGRYQLPDVAGKPAGGAEYMVMWTAVLGGDDGTGRDFDMVHFTGPQDMRAFFGCGREDVTGCIERAVRTTNGISWSASTASAHWAIRSPSSSTAAPLLRRRWRWTSRRVTSCDERVTGRSAVAGIPA